MKPADPLIGKEIETMTIHLSYLRQMPRWMKKRDVLDLEDRPKLSISDK